MKSSSVLAIILIYLASSSSPAISSSASRCFESIISFGDSLTDTGNYPLLYPSDTSHFDRPPYGRTFFHHPTGRCSDGRLIIDFIAQSLGLPLIQPYFAGERRAVDLRSFSKGVNFGVVGATALDSEYYENMGIVQETNASLGIQFGWFKQFLAEIPDSRKFLQKCLVLMGEIGGNDYNHPIQQGMSKEMIYSFVPPVIRSIGSQIEELIKVGVETMLVPGNLPLGCLPAYLTQFGTNSTTQDYDPKTGCLKWLNELAIYHNELLIHELARIRKVYPHATMIYADYYNDAMRFYLSPNEFGFSGQILRACCGAGGPYNYDGKAKCGTSRATCCDDPSLYVSWDGLHLTEAAYRQMALGLIEGTYTTPHISTICPSLLRDGQVYAEWGMLFHN